MSRARFELNDYSQLVVWVGLEDLLCDESFHRLIHLRDQLTLIEHVSE